jgi:arylsulfatase A-like enzyme
MVESMDAAVGRVLAALDRQGLKKNTLVIFTNDNGGERLSSNRPLSHRKGTLWEGGVRVPALARWPGRLPAGKTTPQCAISMDFTATILSAAGVRLPAELDGRNLLPVLEGRRPVEERTFFWRINRKNRRQKAVRQGNWKYLQDESTEVLFNLARDPEEKNTLAPEHPEVVARLRSALNEWEKELARNPPPRQIL